MKLLFAGTGSGLGRHLLESFGGSAWDRRRSTCEEPNPDAIIHCAWPSRPPETSDGLAEYIQDTLDLTRRLTEWPHRKFIFLSTSEVYPLRGHTGIEDAPIEISAVRNLYGTCKLMAEAIVRASAQNWLILRSTGLLGPHARPSSLIRILTEDSPALTLTAESRFFYLLHRDACAFIRMALEQNLGGIYNLSSSESITLGESASHFGQRVQWGKFNYQVGPIDNRKIANIFPAFRKTSREVVEEYASQLQKAAPAAAHPAPRLATGGEE